MLNQLNSLGHDLVFKITSRSTVQLKAEAALGLSPDKSDPSPSSAFRELFLRSKLTPAVLGIDDDDDINY